MQQSDVNPIAIPVRRLARHCNPLKNSPWGKTVTKNQVRQALRERRLVGVPGTNDHAGRIAFLVENPATDAIDVDVGVPALGHHVRWLVQDGNHRLAAAIYRGQLEIEVDISGQLNFATELFGVECG